jgi:hypothetical protein
VDGVKHLPLHLGDDFPVFFSYQCRFNCSVTAPSWTRRSPDRSTASTSPRFSFQSRANAASSSPKMIRASEPPMKLRLFAESGSIRNGMSTFSRMTQSVSKYEIRTWL